VSAPGPSAVACGSADQLDVDIIVAGTRGTIGIRALLHGSTAGAVHKHGPRGAPAAWPFATTADAR